MKRQLAETNRDDAADEPREVCATHVAAEGNCGCYGERRRRRRR